MTAETTATQAILIDMLCILGRDKMTIQKAQEIVDRAHNANPAPSIPARSLNDGWWKK